ncbi:uncharacterized protein YmfQ (DUF2313 family) [Anaerosolibacter carboniphilus]|uniref:Uncharacterized protein YmfQ (DUF2313 family) n=1 Tax=Anaerosolibacter carboniphilus TaxID=1417629 RepID=A0A841KNU4_9FIRM|nr:putative phage tail protein [Anaerosolibacter carboniphilus]MBB6214951.1 uncharacterized protein YmfQ (DUF2313 family) [Anaerosolibacter carboniphilus]
MSRNELIKHLHKIVRQDPVVNEIMKSAGEDFDSIDSTLEDLYKQYFIDTATWGLDIWEKQLGIKIDYSRSLANRRSLIKAKLRGEGKIDAEKIKSVVDAWTNGNVDVELSSGKIKVTFNDVLGIPDEIEVVKATLEDIKPAHLALLFYFIYLTWDQFDAYNKTWDEWDALNLTWDQRETYQE